MNIEQSGAAELTITGNIKSIEDIQLIKNRVSALVTAGEGRVRLNIPASFSMTSTVIGFLMKLVHRDRVGLEIHVGDRRLFELLDELNLVDVFNVRIVNG